MDFEKLMSSFWDRAPQTPGYFGETVGVYNYLLYRAVENNNNPDLSDLLDEVVSFLTETNFSRVVEALHWLDQANFITYLPAPSIGSAHLSIYLPVENA